MTAFKVVLAVALLITLIICARAPAPRRRARDGDLGRLVAAAVAVYGAGALAALSHRPALAATLYSVGILVCGFAGWLSRGRDDREPPGEDDPVGGDPSRPDGSARPRRDGPSGIDWPAFDRARERWRRRQLVP